MCAGKKFVEPQAVATAEGITDTQAVASPQAVVPSPVIASLQAVTTHEAIAAPQIMHGLLRRRTLFVSDLDGTLLDPSSRVSAESALLLNRAIAAGALFTIATARTPATAVGLLQDVDMHLPGAVMTGAALFDFARREYSRLQFIDEQTVKRLLQLYHKHNLSTFVYTYQGGMLEVYHQGCLNEIEKQFMPERSKPGIKHFNVPADGCSQLPSDLTRTLLLYSVQPWERAKALYDNVLEEHLKVSPLCYHDVYGAEWGQLEVFAPTANKAEAIEQVASDVRADRIVAFGDNVNDLPLFRLADEGIAVANAVPELQARATDVIASNSEPSVAEYILRRTLK